MIGTIVNTFSIILGGLLGLIFRGKLPEKLQKIVMQGISLAVLLIGLEMAFEIKKTDDILIVIFSLVIGGIIGELLELKNRLDSIGNRIKNKIKSKNDFFIKGFVQTSLIYCVGAMAIMGAIQDGINNDPSILFTKSMLDGTTAVAFAATFGLGVLFSAIPVFIYQGSITILAAWAQQLLTETVIADLTATGGLLILAIGLNMLEVSKIKIANLLPSLLVVIIIASF